MRLGARTIKTGIGVIIAMLLAEIIPFIGNVMPTFVVILALQQSVKKTWQMLIDRVVAVIIGGLVAVVMYAAFGNNAIIVGLTIILFISILNALNLSDMIGLAAITVVIIMLNDSNDSIIHVAVMRVIENLIGVLVAVAVNIFIFPPKYDRVLYEELNSTNTEILIRLRAILRKNGEYSSISHDLHWAYAKLGKISKYVSLMKEEQVWSRKAAFRLKRKVVVFRNFEQALQAAIELLHVFHENTNVLFLLPDALRFEIRERVETLCAAHEQIFLKFDGRISPKSVNFFQSTVEFRQELLDHIFEQVDESDKTSEEKLEESNALLLITGAMISYEEALIKLNTVVRSYRVHHNDDQYTVDSLEQQN
ncbi:lantibiotic ABC transporter permease [Aerococcus urinaehominis]|uniref:Lantibiotic ABC transporter permease n=1 Tax=Aerococcus urinaehominis TaxID=128944 RepID=A0A0X8FLK9_9LACT|nr:aromatic acid exporter family protein [Aerococcus urinaehominis]AMB99573.1 lantibiotic ABC transporter permease [Aerococcus urinaehominis]SDM35615.1 Uncharacterized membrane protein YgaE, UPF0421/DUF939 family [Aerococcus urinaehominis]